MHAAMKYEQASFERKTAGSKFLRKILRKFSAPHDNCSGSFYSGAEFYPGGDAPKVNSSEKAASSLLANRCMPRSEAEELRSKLDPEKPFTSRAEFVRLLAALVVLWPVCDNQQI